MKIIRNILKSTLVGGLLFLSFGCNGGGGASQDLTSVNTTGTSASGTTGNSSVSIAKTALTQSENTTVTASFTKTDGTPASGVIVAFTATLGTVNPSTAITNSQGTATVTLMSGSVAGQGQVAANATYDGKTYVNTGNFLVSQPPLNLSPITLGLTTLSYGGSTSVTVTVLDANSSPYTTQDVDVLFTSTQTALGKASISTPVRTVNGVAAATYKASAFSGTDTVTASISGSSVNKTVTVTPLSASAITFVSASPANIGLKGMGGAGIYETSIVTFKVLDVLGQPSANQQVDFTLNTNIGGLTLTAYSGSTLPDGTVSTIVQAGTIATPVRVTAVLRGSTPVIATQSDQLVVSTGVPAQDGFSISLETFNTESWNTDGVDVKITARLSDHFHNPVPNGTAVYFTTSGGSIQSSCLINGGTCTVNWTSQNPRPTNGRAVVLAYSVGEEAFIDLNGNGLADAGEFTDTSEAFRDDNESGLRGINETFIDFNSDGTFNVPDGNYNGVLQGAAYSGASKSKHVFSNSVILMSSTLPGTVSFDSNSLDPLNSVVRFLTISDINGNPMPKGYKITVESNDFFVPNTSRTGANLTVFSVPFATAGASPGTKAVTVRVYRSKNDSTPLASYPFVFSW